MVVALAQAAEVQFEGRRWPLLVAPTQPAPPGPPPPLLMPGRAVLDARSTPWTVEVEVPVVATSSGFLLAPVAARGDTLDRVTLDGEPVPVRPIGDRWVAALDVTRAATLRVRSFVDPRAGALVLPVGAEVTVRGRAFVDGAPRVDGDTWWVGGPSVGLRANPPTRATSGTVVLGETAVGLTVRDASLAARARLRFRVARGTVDTVSFDLSAPPADLEVVSDQVSRVERRGTRVELTLARPERGLVDVEATWTSDLPSGADARVIVPLPVLEGTFRDTTALQVARDTDREVIPTSSLGRALGSALPSWGRGLVDGAPTASFLGARADRAALQLLQTSIVDQPPTVIEVAESVVATNADGRLLMQTRLAVRNDRSAFLTVTAPPGVRLVSARVKGKTALVTPLDATRTLVPLARSVQSVQGSLSFPVELVFWGEGAPWPRRGETTVGLPTYDAPIAAHRTTLHLPPGHRAVGRQGRRIVEQFTEGQGINYGFESGDRRVEQAQALLERAVGAW
ncbi:MAG: hypothetical protein AAF602_04445, partial [Myxococcota bacterium]